MLCIRWLDPRHLLLVTALTPFPFTGSQCSVIQSVMHGATSHD
ncbi:hypothetical protein SynPROSU1_00837 [Synechococcus sp. PROS-U-1]|nr:hypothetical protein SynPROSU1_00837 [Synechococcus sp. PROS-U-1]